MEAATVFIVLLAGISLYFLPTVVAMARQLKVRGGVFLLNLLLGWTLVGWVAALGWAAFAKDTRYHGPPMTGKSITWGDWFRNQAAALCLAPVIAGLLALGSPKALDLLDYLAFWTMGLAISALVHGWQSQRPA